MARSAATPVVRRVVPGTPRASSAGAVLSCLLLAPSPDWVAIDTATGALLRGGLSQKGPLPSVAEDPLRPLSVVLGDQAAPWDPSRPDAVEVSAVSERRAPSRRAVRRLLDAVVCRQESRGILGSVGPSSSYLELDGLRPSVTLLDPGKNGARIVSAYGTATAYFRLGERSYALPVSDGAAEWLADGRIPVTRATLPRGAARPKSDRRNEVAGVKPLEPVYLVVGLDRPIRGQVRKSVLGIVPRR